MKPAIETTILITSLFLLGLSKSETKKDKALDQKKDKPAKNRPKEKLINDDKDEELMNISRKSNKQKAKKNKKSKKQKQDNKTRKDKTQSKRKLATLGKPKELIPEDIKIVKKMEKITAEDLPGAYGEDPTIGMVKQNGISLKKDDKRFRNTDV